MKRLTKIITAILLVCLLTAGSVIGASAACNERVIYYVGNNGNCNSDNACDQGGDCPPLSGLYDILKRYGCSDDQCKSLSDLLRSYGIDCGTCEDSDCYNAEPTEPSAPAPTQAPATEAPAPKPTEKPAPKPAETTTPTEKPTQPPTQKPTEAPKPTVAPAPKPAEQPQDSAGLSAYELEVVRLINDIRAQYGLSALKANAELSRVARIKSQDMHDRGYFSHSSPTYGSPFDMMKSFGIRYRTAGENIAMGYRTPQSVVDGWMNSEGHRANILNSSFTEIGVGYVASGNYWTQMFIG